MIIVVLMSDLLPLSLKEFRLVSFFFPYVHILLNFVGHVGGTMYSISFLDMC